jgi:hypothetical protein
MKKTLSLTGVYAAVLLLVSANKAPAQEIDEANAYPVPSYYSGSYYNPYPAGYVGGAIYRPGVGWYGRPGYGWYGARYRAGGYWGTRYRGGYGGRYAYGYRGYRVGGIRRW